MLGEQLGQPTASEPPTGAQHPKELDRFLNVALPGEQLDSSGCP
jgi:hypothetical protein